LQKRSDWYGSVVGFLRFLGRHLRSAFFGAIGIALMVLGYADQAADLWVSAQPWQLQAGGAALIVLAIILMMYRWDQEHQTRHTAGHAAANLPTAASIPAPVTSPSIAPPPVEAEAEPDQPRKAGRVYVGKNITPGYLRSLYQNQTRYHADLATAPFKGKWIRVLGRVQDVSPQPKGVFFVHIKHDRPTNSSPVESVASTMLIFRQNTERLEILHKDDWVRADGVINMIDKMGLTLENCELVD
jgi:hypothetical protein